MVLPWGKLENVALIVPPLSLDGSILTIRKFASDPFTAEDLIHFGTLDERSVRFLRACIEVAGDAHDQPVLIPMTDDDHGGALIPLLDRERPMGALIALSRQPGRFDHDALHLLQAVAHLLAALVQRRRMEEQLAHAQRLDAIAAHLGAGARAGGGAGFGGFPVSGQWLKCTNPAVIARHEAKVYGKASVGSPPMSVPHLDSRMIDGRKELLFGPYAGFSSIQIILLDFSFSIHQ